MASSQLDIPQLASFCSVPEASVVTLLDQPTAELVRGFLEAVSSKVQQYNELRSKKLKADVELENAVRGGESKARLLKTSLDKAQKENSTLRQEVQDEASARSAAETELEAFKTSESSSTSEINLLQTRVATLESSNRETLSLLESKTSAYDNLIQDLNVQHQKTVELRRQVSELEQAVQSANTASSNARFHEQALQQELEQIKRSNDWLEKELKTKSDEFARLRKEKSLRISELQREAEDASGEIATLRSTETTLRRRLDEVGEKADDAFQKIQHLEESSARKEESFRLELDAANRLQDLTRKSAQTEQRRQQELLAELEAAEEKLVGQTGRLAAEIETEHQEREAAERKIAELEVELERIQNEASDLRERQLEPSMPHNGVNGFAPHTPTRGNITPQAFSPGSTRSKLGLSMTQMYSNYSDISRKYEAERRRNEELAATIDGMIQEMEARGPEIEDTRVEKNRLESEVAEISSLINTVSQERDQAVKAAKRWEGQVNARSTEANVLRQQLRDLSSQIKVLLMEAHLRTQGNDEIASEERARLEQIAQGQIDEEGNDNESPTSQFISESLVTFRAISELQEQNQNLLKITREIGERMEHEEALRKQREAARDWEDLQQKYERCKDEVKSLATQSQSYIRERDMFRRMLTHRGQIPRGHESMFEESIIEEAGDVSTGQLEAHKSIEDEPSARDHADFAKLIKDHQVHFDSYKQEAETDKRTLKEQINSISKDNSTLRSEIAKNNSQVSLAHERYEMLKANYEMLKTENSELQKRAQSYSESAAKQDLRVQQVAEDLVEAKGLIDSMRNETANLKAEKDFWKTIEKRINEDNENLLSERNRLNGLNTTLQNMLNEREHSESETRRRLHTQIESLERDIQALKMKLAEETEENKRASQRREYDHEKNQKRIDDLITSLSSAREELASAKTTRDHLSVRVDELNIQLRSAEERLAVLQSNSNGETTTNTFNPEQPSTSGEESGISKEQELTVQISELKRDLDLSKAELANSKAQIEQYKAISQASEEELASLNETQDLYREETETALGKKDSRIEELEQRIEDIAAELNSTNTELANLRNGQSEHNRRLEEQKAAYEAELAKVKDEDERHAATAQYYQEDLKVQAEIAQQAQQNYESELLKHADAAKNLQKVRADFNAVKLELAEAKTDLETIRTNLAQSEESWLESKERLEREISELKSARTDLKSQNERLHQQLETFSSRVQQPMVAVSEDASEAPAETQLGNLQEVIKYLRREKEIVDVQLELSSQETKRLRQQLDYTQSQLDETRLKLNQQRRLEAETERMALDHSKLMETINDLNTLRESNVTLRAENRQAQTSLATRTREVEELRGQFEPLQAEIRELNLKCELREEEAKQAKEDSERWQQRAQNVLQKYDRIDPAELEALKEQLKTAESTRDQLAAANQSLQGQVSSATDEINKAQEQSNERIEAMKARLTEQFKGRSKQLSDRIKEKDVALQTALTEKQDLEQRLANLAGVQQELEILKADKEAAVQQAMVNTSATNSNPPAQDEEGQISEDLAGNPTQAELQKSLEDAKQRLREAETDSARLQTSLIASSSRVTELEAELKVAKEKLETVNSELVRAESSRKEAAESSGKELEEQMAKLRGELIQAQEEAENLRAAASVSASIIGNASTDGEKSIANQVAEHADAVRAELEARHQERVKQTDDLLERRTKQMKDGLTKKLTEGKAQIRQSLQEEHEKTLQNLQTEHQKTIESLQVRHKEELDELRRQEESRFSELKASLKPATEAEGSEGGAIVKSEAKPAEGWQPSEQEIRSLVQSSEVVRGILKNNVIKQVNKAKEDLSNLLKEQHEKDVAQRLIDLQSKADAAKEHAVALETKKTSLQINMATNKAKASQVKLDVVAKAAEETPQKPVSEVWAVAKDAKPSAAPPGQPQPTPKAAAPPTATFGKPSGAILASSSSFSQNQQADPPRAVPGAAPLVPSNVPTFGRPTPPIHTPRPDQSLPHPPVPSTTANLNIAQPQVPQQFAPPPPKPPVSMVPPAQNQGIGHHPNAGTGPAALRGLQSGLPVARGAAARGNTGGRGNPRGRGSNIPRGGGPPIDTTRAQGAGQARGSPTSTGAKQFVPGNKRPREEGQENGSDGKRIRGASEAGDAGASS